MRARSLLPPSLLASLALAAAVGAGAPESVPLPSGRRLTPAGRQTPLTGFPLNLVASPDGRFLVTATAGPRAAVHVLSGVDGSAVSRLELADRQGGANPGLGYGLAFAPVQAEGGWPLYVSRGDQDRISILTLGGDGALRLNRKAVEHPSAKGKAFPHDIGGLALGAGGAHLYVVNSNTGRETDGVGSLSVVDLGRNQVLARHVVGGFPLAVAAPTLGPAADRAVFVSSERDSLVSSVHLATGKVRSIPVGSGAGAMLLDRKQERLFVASAGSDTLSVIDTDTDGVVRTVSVRPEPVRALPCATPLGMALSFDETRLFVALADLNAVAVISTSDYRVQGYIPVGWYPTAVVTSADGKRLFVANGRGDATRVPNLPAGAAGPSPRGTPEHVLQRRAGSVSTLDVPTGGQLRRLTEQVLQNNGIPALQADAVRADFKNPGIEHVIYVVQEGRTYDQVLGDLPRGKGNPALCAFPRTVTPNMHALAERFALLDNFYCAGAVSADGWNWTTAAGASAYSVRNGAREVRAAAHLGDHEGRQDGQAPDLYGRADVARPAGPYVWDRLAAERLAFRNYGVFVGGSLEAGRRPSRTAPPAKPMPGTAPPPVEEGDQAVKRALTAQTDPNYREFDLDFADSDAWVTHNAPAPGQRLKFGKFGARSRFEAWKREFDGYVKSGRLPRCMLVRLPRSHTAGASPGRPSPRAMMADSDYALGQLVEAVSGSPFWEKTAVIVVQSDAQDGFDHVDAQRSPCLVISPYVAVGTTDSRFYNTVGALRTVGLLLGMRPWGLSDAVAEPLRVFGDRPVNRGPYAALLPGRAIIAETNP
jgi:YVTN family beta-propeller protein